MSRDTSLPHMEIVKWRDAQDDQGWKTSIDVDDKNTIITSIGFVIKETKLNLTLAMDMADDGMSNGRGRIPKVLLISRRRIAVTKTK